MRHLFFALGFAALCFGTALQAAEPSDADVWQLVRRSRALYESLDGVEYEVHVRSPEVEAMLEAKGGGLAGTPDLRIIRRNRANQIIISLPEMPELFRAQAEARLQQEAGKLDAVRTMRELGWTLFAGFLRTVDAGGRYDVIEWKDDFALVEFNELGEPMMGRIIRSCRIRFDRRNFTILQTRLWFGGTNTLDVDATYDLAAFFPGTRVPLVKSLRAATNGFTGLPVVSFIMLDGKYQRSADARADDASTSQRAQLKRAGLSRHQIDTAKVDADGNISLDFSYAPPDGLAALRGLPVTALNLTKTGLADLAVLKGLPLRSLILDDCPVEDLTPLLGLPIESLSLRRIRAVDLRVVAQLPLKKLSIGGTTGNVDLSLLKDLKLEELDLESRPVTDLTPLQGMPLRDLVLKWSNVSDLSPLKGMPLRRLDCTGLPITDLTALAQCTSLRQLNLSSTRIEDLHPLAGMKLVALWAGDTRVRDFSPLRGMPLKLLTAHNTPATDVNPLADCRALEKLTLPRSARNVGIVRELPSLQELSFRWDYIREVPSQTSDVFWKEFDSGTVQLADQVFATFAEALRAAHIDARPIQNDDGTIGLSLDGKPILDLSFLANYPITTLSLRETKVRDLSPLRGMMLRRLSIDGTQVADISVLAGMPLEILSMAATPVADLASLADMPLKRLSLGLCPNLGNLQVLKTMTALEAVVLPPGAQDFEFLRTWPRMHELSFLLDPFGFRPSQTADAFWADEKQLPGQAREKARELMQKRFAPPAGEAPSR